jgi:hypothetical protein
MNLERNRSLKLALLVLLAIPAFAGTVTISTGATWGSLSASDLYFASGQAWTLSLDFADPPVPVTSFPGFFSANYSNAVYTLNGNPVAVTGNTAYFYTNQSFDICLDDSCLYQISSYNGSDVLFTGPTSSPAFVPPGTYHTDSFGFAAGQSNVHIGDASGVSTILVSSTGVAGVPEPASIALIGAGLGLIFTRRLINSCGRPRPSTPSRPA